MQLENFVRSLPMVSAELNGKSKIAKFKEILGYLPVTKKLKILIVNGVIVHCNDAVTKNIVVR